MASVSMGQLRFSGASQCYEELGRRTFDSGSSDSQEHDYLNKKQAGYTRTYLDYLIGSTTSEDEDEVNSYADLVIKLNPSNNSVANQYDAGTSRPTTFNRNTDYYAYIDLPQDINYEMIFDIKLVKIDTMTGVENYQYIKTFTVPRSTTASSTTAHTVALYALDRNNEKSAVKAMIPLEVEGQLTAANVIKQHSKIEIGTLYKRKNANQFAVGISRNGSTVLELTDHVNANIMIETWKTDRTTARKGVELVFRPVADGFNMLKIQMRRTTDDQLMSGKVTCADGTEQENQGRAVALGEVQYKLFQLENLVPVATSSDEGEFSRFSVWSHPGLMMAVNGEEIRVGSSGFYELDVLQVTSLGIVAQDFSDNWTLDYEFNR